MNSKKVTSENKRLSYKEFIKMKTGNEIDEKKLIEARNKNSNVIHDNNLLDRIGEN